MIRRVLPAIALAAGLAVTFQSSPAVACHPPEIYPPSEWPQCTTTTTEPETTTTTEPPTTTTTVPSSTTSTLPVETTTTAVVTSVPSIPSSLPPGPDPAPAPEAPQLAYTGGFDVRSFLVGLVFLVIGVGFVTLGKVVERRKLEQRGGNWRTR